MKRAAVLLLLCLQFSLIAFSAGRGNPELVLNGKRISVEYGRPELGGRDMLGRASPGAIWRMGMNKTTTLSTEVDLMFGDEKIAKGTYSLLAECVAADSWRLIVNSEPEIRGNRRDPAQDVATILLETNKLEESIETFTISLTGTGENSGEFSLGWGDRELKADFSTTD